MEELKVIIICILFFAFQLLLCFKSKKLLIQLIPITLVTLTFIVSLILVRTAQGWDVLGYIPFLFLSGVLFIPCVAGWAVFGIYNLLKNRM